MLVLVHLSCYVLLLILLYLTIYIQVCHPISLEAPVGVKEKGLNLLSLCPQSIHWPKPDQLS